MKTICKSILIILIFTFSAASLFAQREVDITANGVPLVDLTRLVLGIDLKITSNRPGNLFGYYDKINIDVIVTNNTRDVQKGDIDISIRNSFGTVIYVDGLNVELNPGDFEEIPLDLSGYDLPYGPYQVHVLMKFDRIGWVSGSGRFSVYDNYKQAKSDWFGINYIGDVNSERANDDFQMFALLGVKNLRFTLNGWLPQGTTSIDDINNSYRIVNRAKSYGFSLLCNFIPVHNTDMRANPIIADTEMNESLLAALTRYNNDISDWEISPSSSAVTIAGGRGIRYGEISNLRNTVQKFDKKRSMVIGLDSPITGNAREAFYFKLPQKSDKFGIHYSYIGIPEYFRANPIPPVFDLPDVLSEAKSKLKYVPEVWMTDVGFDRDKNLPNADKQAVLMARALILNKASGIERIYWRNDPEETKDLPFIAADGSVNPSFLAIRNLISQLDGTSITDAIRISDVMSNRRPGNVSPAHVYMFRNDKKKNKQNKQILVFWCDDESARDQLLIDSHLNEITMTDIWGNSMVLYPLDGKISVPITDSPIFLNVSNAKNLTVSSSSAILSFSSKIKRINETMTGEEARIYLNVTNNQMLFKGKQAISISVECKPFLAEPLIKSFELLSGQTMRLELPTFTISDEDKINGKGLAEMVAKMYIGNQCIAVATLPIYYISPK